jgi:hypothetical protein
LPLGRKVHVYQASEYDLTGVGGNGSARLSYWLSNARVTPTSRLEFQANYQRGRSVDARSLALDLLQGVAVSSEGVRGLLFESVGGRAWFTVLPRVRVTGGCSRDRTNRSEGGNNRYDFGASAWNIAGMDFYLTRSAINGDRTCAAWDASVGRTVGSRLYVTGEFSTDLSSVRLADEGGGFIIEHRPRTRRYGVSTLRSRSTVRWSASRFDSEIS